MKTKKLLSIFIIALLAVCFAFPLAACGGDGGETAVDSVDFDKSTITLNVGDEQTLTYTVFPLGAASAKAMWLSSDPSVATVDNGTVKGISAGSATIRVTVGGKSANCTVYVVDSSLSGGAATGITLNKHSVTLEVNKSETLTATVSPDGANKTVTWSSSFEDVATVDNSGKVTAVGAGTAVITARTSNNLTDNCVLTVSGTAAATELYVEKVSSLAERDDFIMGMDSSEILSIEQARKANDQPMFKNFDGEEEDVFQILKDNGITDIRIRVWNDPYDASGNSYGGGNCDVENAVEISKRCEAVGLGVIIDFHYSDFWADPGKQTLPKAWAGLSTDAIATEIYEFTKASLTDIKETGVKITMVQIGNETTSSMSGASDWSVICKYMKQGSKAVREVAKGAKVAVHFTNAGSGNYLSRAQTLANNSVDYDVFGTSWYPYYSSHGSLKNLATQLENVHKTYGKEVMVLETAYAFTYEDADGLGNTAFETTAQPVTVQGMSNAVRDVIKTIADLGDYGLGICYWGGTWISATTSTSWQVNQPICKEYGCGWATSYAKGYDKDANDGGTMVDNNAFFLSDGTPLKALKVFKYAKDGNVARIAADYLYDQEIYYTVNEGSISLPATVDIVLNNGSNQIVPAIWAIEPTQLTDYIAAASMYTVTGTTQYGGTCYCYIWVTNVNLLTEGSFEGFTAYGDSTTKTVQTALGDWKLTYNNSNTGDLQLFVSNNAGNARMGVKSFHFWDSGVIDFELSQTLDKSKLADNGKYGCSFDFQGADGGNIDIYAYITVKYKDGTEKTVKGNNAAMNGWQNWSRTAISGVEVDDTVASVTVGVHVYAEVVSNGPWGNIDNAQFYFEG